MKNGKSNRRISTANLIILTIIFLCGGAALAVSNRVLTSIAAETNGAAANPTPKTKVPKAATEIKKPTTLKTKSGMSPSGGADSSIVYGIGYGGYSRILKKDLSQESDDTELSGYSDTQPDWSPDGSKIVYASGRDKGDNSSNRELYMMNEDGTNQRRLTFTPATTRNEHPKFSPDGTRVVYTEQNDSDDSEIKILNLADLTTTVITNNDENEQTPDWSPDGAQIIFTRDGNIYTIAANGMDEVLLLDDFNYYISSPSYSPDGTHIVFSRGSNTDDNIYVANADGSNVHAVSSTAYGTPDEEPAWSPDGTRIVFVRHFFAAGRDEEKTSAKLSQTKTRKTVRAKDADQTRNSPQPAGTDRGIYTVSADGTSETRIIVESQYEFLSNPSWQPICGGAIIQNNLVSWWRAEGNADDSGGANDGTASGDTAYQNGRIGQAFDFDGSDDYVEVPDNDSLDVGVGDYTLAAWVNIRAANGDTHYIAGKGALGDYNSAYYLAINGQNHPYFQLWTADGTQGFIGESAQAISPNEWHHLLMKKEGGDVKLFVDGVERASESPGNFFGGNSAPFTIGKGDASSSPTFSTNGLIDEVLLYDRALSDTEITTLYNGSNPPCQSAPQLRLKIAGSNPVSAGRQTAMTVYLPDFAPQGGTTVNLQAVGEAGAITIPASVFVSEGANEATFTISTAITNQHKSVDIAATAGSLSGRATVSINPAVADLTVSNLNAPTSVEILQNFTASWTTTNVGQAATNNGDWADCLFISPDDQYGNNNDTQVGCYYHSAVLNVNESRAASITYANIPGAAIPSDGDYFLFVFTNSNFRVNEREQFFVNNYVSRPIHISRHLPDYVAANVNAPATIEPGTLFPISWTTRNAGSRDATVNSNDYVYYSLDEIAGNSDDIFLGGLGTSPLGVGEEEQHSINGYLSTLPVRPSADAFIYVKVDNLNNIYEGEPNETSEQNNRAFRPVRFEYRVPDLQVQSITPPAEAETDTEFALQWTTRNDDNKDTGYFNDVIFFSRDNTPSGDDVVIGNFQLDGLAANTSVDRIQNVTIPTSEIPATGDYFVYVQSDYYGTIDEGANENNNIRVQPIHVRRFLRPDLQVANITAPAAAFFDQTIQIQWTVTNNGPGATNSNQWLDGVYLSVSQTPSGAGIQPTNVNSLLVGESYITSANFRIPRGLSGSYNIVVRTDDYNQVNEDNESNNVLSKPIQINVPPVPDLRVSNIQAPAEGFAGQNISVSWTVTNSGTGATLAGETGWWDAVYISQDATLDGGDIYVGRREHAGALQQNASYTASGFSVQLPNNVIGNYYVFVVADIYGQLYEYNSEDNNSDYDRVQPGSPMNVIAAPPDLTITTPLAAPSAGNADSDIGVSFTVKNQGAFDAGGAWYEAVYLSADQNLSDDDTLLGYAQRSGLTAGTQYAASFGVHLPACISGNFYLIAKTDFDNRVFEYDPNFNAENNNTTQARPIQISNTVADLQVTNVQSPPVATAGQAMNVQWTVKNFGAGATAQTAWTDRVLLYAEPNQPPIVLGTFQHSGSLAPNATYTQNQVVILPNFLQGNYQLTIQTDAFGQVPECSFEDNNYGTGSTFDVPNSLPDLRVPTVTPISTAVLGSTVNVQYTGANNGAAMSQQQSWIDRVYLSYNDQYDESYDRSVGGQISNAQLGANQTYANQIAATLPNVSPGNYFLIVVADADGNIVEGSPNGLTEQNNWRAFPITLTAPGVDLQAVNVTANAALYSGLTSDIGWTVTNAGSSATLSDSWTDYVILSRDTVYDQTDRVIGYRQHNGVLNGGASYTETMPTYVPAGLTGEYNIFVITDRGNNVIENNESNNLSAPRAVVLDLAPPSDLNITNITPPANAAPGENATFTWTIQNSGANDAQGLWTDTVYLSTDQTWDVTDAIVGTQTHAGTVNPATNYTASLTAPVPPIDTGNYYVIVRTDARNTVRESNEANNLSSSASPVAVAVQTLTLGIPVSTSLVTNQEKFYKYDTPADETLLVTLIGQNGSVNELFTCFGSIVNRSNYQFQSARQGEANQENVVPVTQAGTYYSMIRGDYVPNSFARDFNKADASKAANGGSVSAPTAESVTLKAEIVPFSVRRVSPTTAGNKGLATLLVEGAKFQPGATVKLVGANNAEILPKTTEVGASRIAAIFDLNGKAAGTYSVVARNPNNQTATLSDGFQVVNGGGYRLHGGVVGPNAVDHVRTRFVVTAVNEGLNDALYVPIVIRVPAAYGFELDRRNYIDFPTEDLPPDAVPSQIPLYADKDGIRTIMLFAPILRSRSTIEVGFDLTPPPFFADFDIEARVFPPLVEYGQFLGPRPGDENFQRGVYGPYSPQADPNPAWSACWAELFRSIFFTVFNALLPSDCLQAGWTLLASSADLLTGLALKGATGGFNSDGRLAALDAVGTLAGKFVSVAGKLAECVGREIPWLQAVALALSAFQIAYNFIDCLIQADKLHVVRPYSVDPNEKLGPDGYGAERWVPVRQPLLYTIKFENLSTATAPAQQIRIVDNLPPAFDPRTLRLREIGFKQYRVTIPDNRASYQSRIALGADLNNLQANISAGLDIVNNRVIWTLTAIDPMTNEQPLNPLVGLLPPNNASFDGEGFVTFTVEASDAAPTHTNLANTATIYFDDNEPIATNTTTNLLDADLPTSALAALPATQTSPTFQIAWSGGDAPNGSGFKSYDVWAAEDTPTNQGAFFKFLSNTTETSATFNGKYGRTYRFYSVARDNAGNVEAAPVAPDATTQVAGGAFEGDVNPRPNGDNNGQVADTDVDQIRRFVAKLDAAYQLNEFQRADTAPLSTRGDGILSAADVIQARRYKQSLDAVAEADGANAPALFGSTSTMNNSASENLSARKSKVANSAGVKAAANPNVHPPRELRPVRVGRTGNKLVLGVELEAQGDEAGASFTLNFDTTHLSNPQNIALGSGASGATLTANTAEAAQGRIGIVIDKTPNQPIAAGTKQLVTIEFDVAANPPATTNFSFGSALVVNEIASGAAAPLTAAFTSAPVSLGAPTAANVTVAGRATTANGSGIYQARVALTDATGATRIVLTNSFGYYRFADVAAGETYIVAATHKRYQFTNPTRVLNVVEDLEEVNFIASP